MRIKTNKKYRKKAAMGNALHRYMQLYTHIPYIA